MNLRLHLAVALLSTAALPACSAAPAPATPRGVIAMETTACDAMLPVREGRATWTLEGFDGAGETQLFSTKRQPVKRCSPAVVQNRRATLDALH